jgi:hypothetical protein
MTLESRPCGWCERAFEPKVEWQKYCQEACRLARYYVDKVAEGQAPPAGGETR